MFNAEKLRADFPILSPEAGGNPLTYLDNAATTQKPAVVIDAISEWYRVRNANVHRGVSRMVDEATEAYEDARKTVAGFINAADPLEVVFTGGTTDSLNLLAYTICRGLKPRDVIVLTEMEHHSNLVPWFIQAERHDLELRFVQLGDEGALDMADFDKQVDGAKVVSLTHISNVLGTINPVADIATRAKAAGALTIVDAAQSVPNMPVDVQTLGADFVAFSSHKMLGPTGVGVLWGTKTALEALPPFKGGGQMIREVDLDQISYAEPPWRFEAGTMPAADVIGFAAAVSYLDTLGMAEVRAHEQELTQYALEQLRELDGIRLFGPKSAGDRGGLVSFAVEDVHAHDLSTLLNEENIMIRSGHHCAQPLHRALGVQATARVSFTVYNTNNDVDRLVRGIKEAQKTFARK